MNAALSEVKWQFVLVSLYNIVIFSRAATEQIDHFSHDLPILWDAEVTLKLMKCNFVMETMDYLFHLSPPVRVKIASHTTADIKELSYPQNVTELKTFLGFRMVFRRIVHNIARIASLINNTLQKTSGSTSNWTKKSSKQYRANSRSWSLRWYWHYCTPMGELYWTQLLAMFKTDV